jgi:hypothetical protein
LIIIIIRIPVMGTSLTVSSWKWEAWASGELGQQGNKESGVTRFDRFLSFPLTLFDHTMHGICNGLFDK